jgi:hypothetical protein
MADPDTTDPDTTDSTDTPTGPDAGSQDWDLSSALGGQEALNDAMDRVGANLGRSGGPGSGSPGEETAPDATAEPDTGATGPDTTDSDPAGPGGETTDTGGSEKDEPISADEQLAEEFSDLTGANTSSADEEAAPGSGKDTEGNLSGDGETDDETGEGPSAEEEATGEAADTDGETTDEETPDEETPEAESLPTRLKDEVQMRFPDRVVETTEDLTEAIEEERELSDAMRMLDQVTEQKVPEMEDFVDLILNEDADPREAVLTAFQPYIESPDPTDDPDAYAEWKHQRKKAKERRQQEHEQEETLSEVESNIQDQMLQSLKGAKQQLDLDDSAFDRFVQETTLYLAGDRNGNLPPDFGKRMYIATHADQILSTVRQKAFEQGKKEGRQAAHEDERERRLGDGLPKPSGSSEPATETTEREELLQSLGQSFDDAQLDVDDFSL